MAATGNGGRWRADEAGVIQSSIARGMGRETLSRLEGIASACGTAESASVGSGKSIAVRGPHIGVRR